MLLSFPNWIIHIFSSLEWLAASLLLVRYGRLIGRRSVTILGLSMLPHWAGSLSVLAYHITTDTVPFLLDLSEIINLFGSISLLLATVSILKETKKAAPAGFMALMGAIMISGKPQSWLGEDVFDAILQLSSVVYISFLIVLLVIWRRNRDLFSGLTVGDSGLFLSLFRLPSSACIWQPRSGATRPSPMTTFCMALQRVC